MVMYQKKRKGKKTEWDVVNDKRCTKNPFAVLIKYLKAPEVTKAGPALITNNFFTLQQFCTKRIIP